MISPYGCWGRPHKACWSNNIPIIVVKNNKVIRDVESKISLEFMSYKERKCIIVENYLEAVGLIQAMKEGIEKGYFFRPIKPTKIIKETNG